MNNEKKSNSVTKRKKKTERKGVQYNVFIIINRMSTVEFLLMVCTETISLISCNKTV